MKSNTPMGCEGLVKKWHKTTLDNIKRLMLPTPDHAYGFSSKLLKSSLTEQEWAKFAMWMNGQTCMLDKKLGIINYTHDVIRGLDYIRHKTPTFWD